MRIAHVTDFYEPRLGGIEVHVADLAQRQRAHGHDVEVITSSPGPAQFGVHRLGEHLRRPHFLHPAALRRGLITVRQDYDLVHVHAGLVSPLAYFSAREAARAGVPTVVTVHSLLDGYQVLFRRLDQLLGISALPITWTAVSATAARGLRGVVRAPVQVLPNGIDQPQWQRSAPPVTTSDHVNLIAVMRLAPRKRPLALLRMFAQAQHQLEGQVQLRLLVVGAGPGLTSMDRYRQRHRLEGLRLAGRLTRSEVHAALTSSDLFIAPANLESFGIAALEARATGLPVIAKRRAGISEFVRDQKEGVLCDSDQHMVQALVALSADHEQRRRMAEHNRTTPCAADWATVMARTEAIYAHAARDPSAAPGAPLR